MVFPEGIYREGKPDVGCEHELLLVRDDLSVSECVRVQVMTQTQRNQLRAFFSQRTISLRGDSGMRVQPKRAKIHIVVADQRTHNSRSQQLPSVPFRYKCADTHGVQTTAPRWVTAKETEVKWKLPPPPPPPIPQTHSAAQSSRCPLQSGRATNRRLDKSAPW